MRFIFYFYFSPSPKQYASHSSITISIMTQFILEKFIYEHLFMISGSRKVNIFKLLQFKLQHKLHKALKLLFYPKMSTYDNVYHCFHFICSIVSRIISLSLRESDLDQTLESCSGSRRLCFPERINLTQLPGLISSQKGEGHILPPPLKPAPRSGTWAFHSNSIPHFILLYDKGYEIGIQVGGGG